MSRPWVVVAGSSYVGPWRGIVERKPGESDADLLADVGADRIAGQHDTEAEAAAAVDSWTIRVERREREGGSS